MQFYRIFMNGGMKLYIYSYNNMNDMGSNIYYFSCIPIMRNYMWLYSIV